MRNPESGKYQAKKVLKDYNFEIVGYGDTKEEAKADLKTKLEEYRIPGTDAPGYRGPKYRPKMKVAGYVDSPGFVMEMDAEGKTQYVYKADRKAQVFTVDRSTLAETAKVLDTESREES